MFMIICECLILLIIFVCFLIKFIDVHDYLSLVCLTFLGLGVKSS